MNFDDRLLYTMSLINQHFPQGWKKIINCSLNGQNLEKHPQSEPTLTFSTPKYTYLLRQGTLITTDLKFPQHTLAEQQQLSRGHFTQQLRFL